MRYQKKKKNLQFVTRIILRVVSIIFFCYFTRISHKDTGMCGGIGLMLVNGICTYCVWYTPYIITLFFNFKFKHFCFFTIFRFLSVKTRVYDYAIYPSGVYSIIITSGKVCRGENWQNAVTINIATKKFCEVRVKNSSSKKCRKKIMSKVMIR